MQEPQVLTDDDLRRWDWLAELKAQERSIPWLARQTKTVRQQNTVYRYAWGKATPSIEWLREAAEILGVEVTA